MNSMRKAIVILFNLLFFLVPLVFYAKTSEVFEFNKIILTYLTTTLISGFWLIRMVREKKIIFRPSVLDIPLIIFFTSQLISTLVSIDIRSSIFGYYSRFNGGIISTFCYIVLYWAYVSNVKLEETKRLINVAIISGTVVAFYGILEHFGGSISCLLLTGNLNDDCWVQDVRTRVFATLGQPNWMAAYLVALTPFTWSQVLANWTKDKLKKFFWLATGVIFFWAILYTKSRSGLIGLGVAGIIFGALTLIKNKAKKEISKVIVPGIVILSLILLAVGLTGTPWTPSIRDFLGKKTVNELTAKLNTTSEGGTESGDIRKIVWQGAVNVWRSYPVFGTGPETFAFSYYMYRTREHNLVSEWDFLYNKAHNEYLNFAANSGTVGLGAYLVVIGFSIYLVVKLVGKKKDDKGEAIGLIAILSGYASLLVTNFFGFSVVITQLFLFIFPAMAVSLSSKELEEDKDHVLSFGQKLTSVLVVLGCLFVINLVWKYFSADALFARAKAEIGLGSISESVADLNSAIKKSPGEPLYHDKMAQLYAALAKASIQEKDSTSAAKLAEAAISEADLAHTLAPKNFIVLQDRVNIFSDLSSVNPNHIMESVKVLEGLTAYAPNYAKTYYKLGLVYQIIGQKDLAIANLKKAIELKPNYEDAINQLESLTNQKPQ